MAQAIYRRVKALRTADYQEIPNHANHTDLPPEEESRVETDEDEALSINANGGGHLALVRTTTKGSIVQADTPVGEYGLVVAEELAVLGLVATNVIALVTGTYDGHGRLAAAVGLVSWLYTFILTSLRLFLGNTKWRVPRLWNHTATIYGFQWLFTISLFRSVLIRPSSQLTQILIIVEFALTTFLFAVAMSTRKGNKTVVMEIENGMEPSREPLASVFSLMTFAWIEPMLWQGFKEPLELKDVWNLLPRDKAAVVLADYRQLQKTTALALHLIKYFGGMVALQCLWAIFAGFLTFAPTLLLQAILQYVEMPERAPKNVLWLYVILLPVADIVRSIADGQALWIGRKICIQIRAIIIGEIYAKALRRKAASGKEKSSSDAGKKDAAKTSKFDKVKMFLGLKKKAQKPDSQDASSTNEGAATNDSAKEGDDQANLGTIINLMSVDSFKVSEVTAYLHFLCASAPTQLVVAIALLWRVMGLSSIPGLIVMIFLLPINIALAKGFGYTQKKIMKATDKRIHTTNEILQNIRIIKYFAWEQRFSSIVDEKRTAELKALRTRYIIWSIAVAIWNTVPVVISFFSFLVYTKIEHKPLYPSVAFTAISLFLLLRVPLDQIGDMIAHVQEAKVSVDRVEEFLSEDETEKYELLGPDNIDENGNRVIGFRNATFTWGAKSAAAADDDLAAFRLLDINVDFRIGKVNIICGPTGSGKTSMLMALLGEMTLAKGKVYLPGGRSREDVRPDPETGLTETCAYVAQTAWLVNANIKENILFAAPYDEKRYRDVIVACALERDLEILDNGDETLVGENGISLSGGQKQRISLARAVYSSSRHLLLDDCLSAVDSHTAKWIFNNCINGPLMKDRTCILVSHNTTLCVPSADYVVLLDNGRVEIQGSATEVIVSGKLGEELQNKSRPGSAHVSRVPSRVPSSVGEESGATLVDDGGHGSGLSQPKKDSKQKDAMEETKATGSVKWPVIKLYLNAMGSWWFWIITILVFGGQQLGSVASNLWIRRWANQYTDDVQEVVSGFHLSTSSHASISSLASPTFFAPVFDFFRNAGMPATYSTADAPTVNADYYLLVLALIGIVSAFLALIRDLWLFFGSLTASRKIHNWLMSSVARAKFKFFDVTPLGQLMNRFSKDLEAVDQEIAPVAVGVMSCALGILVTVVLIAMVTPGFLIAAVFITVLYIFVGIFYLRASRDLKRLESVNRSPLFQQFGETLSGVTTIRAYGDERRFVRENLSKINTQARPFIYLWAANRWLAVRTDFLGDFVAFFAGVFVILSMDTIDAGSAGLSLSYAISFSDNILWLIRLYAINEQNMNAVERVKEYLDVEQEADAIVEYSRPPPNWPTHGSVEFFEYSTRYREDLDPVLKKISFKIYPREKVGIVGRTGAGKSSLTLAIFRALEADRGKILIDDVDIGTIGLQDLREAITIVPQDPTLFTGTIRTNLDPFELYTDEEIFTALRRVQLIGPDENPKTPITPMNGQNLLPSSTPSTSNDAVPNNGDDVPGTGATSPTLATNKNIFLDLSSPVSESGNNLSQGQRQLLCLARAMLKDPRVLVMDEATASIDYATDAKIQGTIRELQSTIITIAHRLATIADYDKVLVLDRGEVVEFAHPYELINRKDGLFRQMCEMSGDLENLRRTAKKAWDAKLLLDVDSA